MHSHPDDSKDWDGLLPNTRNPKPSTLNSAVKPWFLSRARDVNVVNWLIPQKLLEGLGSGFRVQGAAPEALNPKPVYHFGFLASGLSYTPRAYRSPASISNFNLCNCEVEASNRTLASRSGL